mgnify:FL=1
MHTLESGSGVAAGPGLSDSGTTTTQIQTRPVPTNHLPVSTPPSDQLQGLLPSIVVEQDSTANFTRDASAVSSMSPLVTETSPSANITPPPVNITPPPVINNPPVTNTPLLVANISPPVIDKTPTVTGLSTLSAPAQPLLPDIIVTDIRSLPDVQITPDDMDRVKQEASTSPDIVVSDPSQVNASGLV